MHQSRTITYAKAEVNTGKDIAGTFGVFYWGGTAGLNGASSPRLR